MKMGLSITAAAAIASLALGCGGDSTTTVVQESSTTETTTDSALTPAGGISLASVVQCVEDAGGTVESGVQKMGPGTGFIAILPEGTFGGAVTAPDAAVAKGLATSFGADFDINETSDSNTLVIFKGTVDEADRQTMSDCIVAGGG